MRLSQLPAYLETARNIANRHGINSFWILFRLLYCRLRYGFHSRDFARFMFYSRPFSAPKAYLKKLDLESLQVLVNTEAAREIVDNKLRFFQICKKHGLPTPTILGLVDSSEHNHSSDGIPLIREPEQLLEIIRLEGEGKYLFKPAHGALGAGITRFALKNNRLIEDNGETIEAKKVLTNLLDQQSPIILQKCLRPHPKLRPIMPSGSLGTARILTVNVDGEVRVFMACLKIPTGGNVADNFHSGRTGNLVAAVDMDSGYLLNSFGPGPDKSGLIEEVVYHPDTGEPLRGFKIPCWQELLDAAINGAIAFCELGTIGWDVALTEDGPCLIEGNARYGCGIEQILLGRGMKPDFECLLSESIR